MIKILHIGDVHLDSPFSSLEYDLRVGYKKRLFDDFCRAVETGKLSATNIWEVARYNLPGLIAHQSALQGGAVMEVPDLGDPPADWEILWKD